jgi:iron complex outermembrane receptor protein
MEDPSVVGNKAPLASKTTLNLGAQYRQPIVANLMGVVRVDFQQFGRTWWEPYNTTSRDPVSLLNARLGIQGDQWNLTAWGKNLTDKIYNAEFSPGGFLFRARPRTYGLEFQYNF